MCGGERKKTLGSLRKGRRSLNRTRGEKKDTIERMKKTEKISNYAALNYRIKGRAPRGIINNRVEPKTTEEIRLRAKILALNVGNSPSKKALLGNYMNDNGVHVVVITESNLTSL